MNTVNSVFSSFIIYHLSHFEFTFFLQGHGVDIYIVDTGLDTTHVEFSPNQHRVVQNVYSAYPDVSFDPGADTDGQGHGTHVAGITDI